MEISTKSGAGASAALSQSKLAAMAPGAAVCIAVAVASWALEKVVKAVATAGGFGRFGIPAAVIALVIGMALHDYASDQRFTAGRSWCGATLLRIAVAFLGLRIALSDIAGLGPAVAIGIVVAMTATVLIGIALARSFKLDGELGVLAGVANAVCGASATLATAAVLPDYQRKSADIVFCVVMANVISTAAMVLYPPVCQLFGLSPKQTGFMLGVSIQDMAQVVGAGYSVSLETGDSSVIVKMYRIFLLAPAVAIIGWGMARDGADGVKGVKGVKVPAFALAFLGFCMLNSLLPSIDAIRPLYLPLKDLMSSLSTFGLLVAISALGLATSFAKLRQIKLAEMAIFSAAAVVMLVAAVVMAIVLV